MAKKKQAKTAKNFSEAIGFGNIFKNDIFNFIFGFVLLLLAVYVTIAFVSYFSTGQADQSLLLDRRPGELLNTHQEYQNSCGSIGAVISYFFISRCFGLSAFIIPVLMALIGLRMMEEVVGSAALDDLSFLHHHDAVGHVVDDAEVVGDEKVGEAVLLLEVVEKVEHLCLDADVEG